MSAQSLLEQLLKSGLQMMQSGSSTSGASLPSVRASTPPAGGSTQGPAGSTPPVGTTTGASGLQWGQIGMGAAAGSALSLLLGSRRGRSLGGKALKVGSVAAIGALAYKAFTAYQAQQAAKGSPTAGASAGAGLGGAPATPAPLQMVDRISAPEVEAHSLAMLKAMVAAAKADGHLDERERSLLQAELERLEADPATREWLQSEIARPLDPDQVAQAATSPELAAEMYLASLLVVDETNTMERLYLDALAQRLKLPEGLKAQLEAQAKAG